LEPEISLSVMKKRDPFSTRTLDLLCSSGGGGGGGGDMVEENDVKQL
jgi:hypothetical protein